MMYMVYKLFGNGTRELLESFEDAVQASKYADEKRHETRRGNNANGELADVVVISSEEEEQAERARIRWDALTEEEKHDVIVVDGKKYIRKIYEETHQ